MYKLHIKDTDSSLDISPSKYKNLKLLVGHHILGVAKIN